MVALARGRVIILILIGMSVGIFLIGGQGKASALIREDSGRGPDYKVISNELIEPGRSGFDHNTGSYIHPKDNRARFASDIYNDIYIESNERMENDEQGRAKADDRDGRSGVIDLDQLVARVDKAWWENRIHLDRQEDLRFDVSGRCFSIKGRWGPDVRAGYSLSGAARLLDWYRLVNFETEARMKSGDRNTASLMIRF